MAQKIKVFYTEGGKEEFDVADKFQLIPGPAVLLETGGGNATVIPLSAVRKMDVHTDEPKVEVVGGKLILPGQSPMPTA